MDTRALQIYDCLRGNGVTVHQVTPSGNDPDEFAVTLELARCEHEHALALLRRLDGVRKAEVSPASPAFLAVLCRPEPTP